MRSISIVTVTPEETRLNANSMCTLFFGEQFLTLAVNGIHTINHVINIPIFGALYTRHIFKLNYHIIFGPC